MNGMGLIEQGGFVMYPLILFSVLVWSVAIHKYILLRAFIKDYRKLDLGVKEAIRISSIDGIKSVFKSSDEKIRCAHEVLVEDLKLDSDALKDRIARRLGEINAHLKENLWILGTISASAPFVGLFGTVVGIMDSFEAIGLSGKSGFSVVAKGISESLIATAAGIIVAVIAVIFYNFLQTRVSKIILEVRHKVEDAADMLQSLKASGK